MTQSWQILVLWDKVVRYLCYGTIVRYLCYGTVVRYLYYRTVVRYLCYGTKLSDTRVMGQLSRYLCYGTKLSNTCVVGQLSDTCVMGQLSDTCVMGQSCQILVLKLKVIRLYHTRRGCSCWFIHRLWNWVYTYDGFIQFSRNSRLNDYIPFTKIPWKLQTKNKPTT